MALTRGAGLDFLQSRFGGPCREVESVTTAGLAVVRAIGFDAERVSLTLINMSANNVYIAPFPTVAATRGIRLSPSGGGVSFNIQDDSLLPCLEWWTLADGATSYVYALVVKRDLALGN